MGNINKVQVGGIAFFLKRRFNDSLQICFGLGAYSVCVIAHDFSWMLKLCK